MIEAFKRVLVFSPHPDDAELIAGATMARLAKAGADVRVVRLSRCVESLGQEVSDALMQEAAQADDVLGVTSEQHDFPGRRFSFKRQAVLDLMIRLRESFVPDLVIVHANGDRHQDHEVTREEALRAFRCTVIGGEAPWSNQPFAPQMFVAALDACMDAKADALAKYTSQAHRSYMTANYVRSLARVRGVQCGAYFAESFEVMRLVS